MIEISDVVAELEAMFTCVPWTGESGPGAGIFGSGISPTGEPYVTFNCGGPQEEGETVAAAFFSAERAVLDWRLWVLDYAKKRGGSILYWRTVPEMGSFTMYVDGTYYDQKEPHPVTMYKIRGRLLISRG